MEVVDPAARRAFAERAAAALSSAPRNADVALDPDGPEVDVVEAAEGIFVDAAALDSRLEDALDAGGAVDVEAPSTVRGPTITDTDAEAVVADARAVVSAPIELTHPADGPDVPIGAADLARVLDVVRDPAAAEGERLALEVDRTALDELLDDVRGIVEAEPSEADISLVDGQPVIEGGTIGFELDSDAVAEQILRVATRTDDRSETLAGSQREPDRTRADAEALNIEEQVSAFTTEFDCCPPRVTNIQLMAEHVDGALIEPGEQFSLNAHVGPRTRERGFVAGGAIIDGEFEEVVGGGSSQFATTFFNAAFFSGIELVEFQPHSYYFPRYPEGREATVSYNVIDVVVRNDSPHGILVAASATDTSVTVEFWSSAWTDVEAFSSGRYNVVEGEQRDGFDIDFGRVITYPDGSSAREEWTHRYEPENDES